MNGAVAMDAKVELCSFTRSYVKKFRLSTARYNLRLLANTNVRGKSVLSYSRKQTAKNIFTYIVLGYI